MLNPQNPERIFLEPIDQLYANQHTKDSPEQEDQVKIFDENSHGVLDYLNISTDSETKNDSVDEDLYIGRITQYLVKDWKNKVDYLRTYKVCVLRSFVIPKLNLLRNTLNRSVIQYTNRTMSCHTVITHESEKPVKPFELTKEQDCDTKEYFEDSKCPMYIIHNLLKKELDN
jgi:hypothetical protein